MQHDNYELLIQLPKKIISFGIRRKQISFFDPICDLQLRGCFSLAVCLNLSLLQFFIAVHWDKRFPPATLFHNFQNIFQKFDTKVATEIHFKTFQFGKHCFQFSVKNWNRKLYVAPTFTSRCRKDFTPCSQIQIPARERVFFTYSTNPLNIFFI